MPETADQLLDVTDTHADTPPITGADSRMIPFRELEKERRQRREAARLAETTRAEADQIKARLAEIEKERDTYKASHDAWTKAQDEARTKATETMAARLAALPDDIRDELEAEIEGGMDPQAAIRWLDRLDKVRGTTPTAAADPVKPVHPVGGRGAQGAPAPDELTPEMKAWVERRRPDLIGVSPATVRKMYAKFSGAT